MTLTSQEATILEGLREQLNYEPVIPMYGVAEENADWYTAQASRCLKMALDHYAAYQIVTAPDYKEKAEQARLEEIKRQQEKMAARSVEVRENLVSGILSGLIPKARRAGSVSFEVSDWNIMITVTENLSGVGVFQLAYDRQAFVLEGYLKGEEFEPEDWSVLGGNRPPKEQSPALKAVLEYLEGLADGSLV